MRKIYYYWNRFSLPDHFCLKCIIIAVTFATKTNLVPPKWRRFHPGVPIPALDFQSEFQGKAGGYRGPSPLLPHHLNCCYSVECSLYPTTLPYLFLHLYQLTMEKTFSSKRFMVLGRVSVSYQVKLITSGDHRRGKAYFPISDGYTELIV